MDKYKFRRTVLCGSIFLLLFGAGCGAVSAGLEEPANASVSSAETTADHAKSAGFTNAVETTSFDRVATNNVNPICPTCGQIIEGPEVFLTSSEINLLASLVELEAGIENYDCKMAVASVVINRMKYYDKDLNDIIYASNQFSVADRIGGYEPTEESVNAVRDVLTAGVTLPEYVTFFRAGHYHNWGDQTPYIQIGNTYFSYSLSVKESLSE